MFWCDNKECVTLNENEEEDNQLVLHARNLELTQYEIKKDGSLEILDSELFSREIYLQRPLCGKEYEFEWEFDIEEKHFLPFSKAKLSSMKLESRKR